MQYVPDFQSAPVFSGTFVLTNPAGTPLGSVPGVMATDWLGFGVTGSMGFLGDAPGRPPLAWGGSGSALAAYPSTSSWGNITGCLCDFNALVRRDYLVLLTVAWIPNERRAYFRLMDNDSTTGIFPGQWQDDYGGGHTSFSDERMCMFLLPNWAPGVHRIQAQWAGLTTKTVRQAYLAVL